MRNTLQTAGGPSLKGRVAPGYEFVGLYAHACARSLQSSPTLCDPMDCSPPGSSLLGISQARILELVVIFSSRGSS